MPKILTSWKEIGQYLGKGVRTVQRWEREAGLPVHRQSRSSRYPVIALLDELDAWARSRTRAPSSALAGALQREIASLHSSNSEFQARLDGLEAAVLALSATRLPYVGHLNGGDGFSHPHNGTSAPPDRAVPVPAGSGYAGGGSREIRLAAQQSRAQAARARLSLAFTLCALSARRGYGGFPALQRAQHSALGIRKSLESPGYVPLAELDELRTLLADVVVRLEMIVQGFACSADPPAPLPARTPK